MLGRQQIAGVQNALVELFKNAHDAYARHVAVDSFDAPDMGGRGYLTVRDDGVGMTLADFVGKWLVLGTESKTSAGGPPFRPDGMEARPITGEKGIGRLAIALLGDQTLVLTRALREDGRHDLVVGLVHWGLYEIPGLNLNEIEVPVETVTGGTLPDAQILGHMRQQLVDCSLRIQREHPEIAMDRIVGQVRSFQPDLRALYGLLGGGEDGGLSLEGDGRRYALPGGPEQSRY